VIAAPALDTAVSAARAAAAANTSLLTESSP
jgi:hypothetical protein